MLLRPTSDAASRRKITVHVIARQNRCLQDYTPHLFESSRATHIKLRVRVTEVSFNAEGAERRPGNTEGAASHEPD